MLKLYDRRNPVIEVKAIAQIPPPKKAHQLPSCCTYFPSLLSSVKIAWFVIRLVRNLIFSVSDESFGLYMVERSPLLS